MGEDRAEVVRTGTESVVLVALQEGLGVAEEGVQGDDEDGARQGAALENARKDDHEELAVFVFSEEGGST